MKISELRSTIEEFIVEVLSEVDTDKARGTAIMSKSAKPSDELGTAPCLAESSQERQGDG
jgi:hypothetical protein